MLIAFLRLLRNCLYLAVSSLSNLDFWYCFIISSKGIINPSYASEPNGSEGKKSPKKVTTATLNIKERLIEKRKAREARKKLIGLINDLFDC